LFGFADFAFAATMKDETPLTLPKFLNRFLS